MQLERFLEHYPKEQILVFQQSELRHQRMETLRRVFEFIGVDPDFNHPRFEQERHQTSGKTRATRLAVRLEKMGRSRRGRMFPSNFWLVLDDRLPLRRAIKRPDVRAALPPETLERAARRRRAPARAHRARLLQLEDLGPVAGPRWPAPDKSSSTTTPAAPARSSGVGVMRNSSVQAITLVVANVMQLVSVLVVAAYLGPSEMARFALLIFLAGLVTQIASLLVKPGTVRRTFGGGDDDDDDDDDDDVASTSPPHTLGTGLVWAIVLGLIATALIYVFRRADRRRAARRSRRRGAGRAGRAAGGTAAGVQDRRHRRSGSSAGRARS